MQYLHPQDGSVERRTGEPVSRAAVKPVFYGWKLSWLSCLANFMLQGSSIYIMNAFIQPLSNAYGWTRGDLGIAMGIGSFCGVMSMPVLSSLAIHMRLRHLMVAGALVGGSGVILMGQFTQLWTFTIAFSLVWIAGQACGGVIANALMSNWFIRYRGRAFGLANFGTSFSGAAVPLIVLVLMQCFDIQMTSLIFGSSIIAILGPLCWLYVKDTPDAMGLHPDGETATLAMQPLDVATFPWRTLLRCLVAYRVGIAFGAGLMMSAGVVSQLKPRFSDLGFGDFEAMGLMCLTAFCAAVGKYFWGWMSDVMPTMRAARLLFLLNIVGLGIAFLPQGVIASFLFAVVCGLFLGGFWTMCPAVVAYLFERERFVSAYRFVSIFILLKSFGYVVMGLSFEMTRGYNAAYIFFMVVLFIGFLLLHGVDKDAVARSIGT